MTEDFLIGRQLANYRVERLLGRGGMAEVYYGWDIKLERPVAIKVIDARFRDSPSYAQRFVHEAQAIAGWRHENIVQIYYADDENGLYYFAMEYIDGMDLRALMNEYAAQGKLIPQREALRIGRAIARALDYAHQRGVIHRDVKPSNVLVDRSERVILTDFGLAMDVAQGSLGEVIGSPHYLAPEQARRSSDAVPASDLYSLGVILYEMLTGRVPFDDPSPASVALQHLTLPPPRPRTINPKLSEQTEGVLLKALDKSPTDRYQSGAELMDALESALRGPKSHATQTRASQSRFPLVFFGVLVFGVAILAAVLASVLGLIGDQAPGSPILISGASPTAQGVDTSNTPTPVPATDNPSAPPSEATASPGEPIVASPTATITPEPTSEVIGASPMPTILYQNGYRVVFFYNERGFYMWNPGDRRLEIGAIVFEALDAATGQPAAYRFEGTLWAAYYRQLMEGRCNALEIIDLPSSSRPAECRIFNASRTPVSSSPWLFWLPREGIGQFRVLWDSQELARCEPTAGFCEAYLP